MTTNYNQVVKDWVLKTVVGLNLCPFAKVPFENNLISFDLSHSQNSDDMLKDFLESLDRLQKSDEYITTILTYPNGNKDFLEFYDFFNLCEEILTQLNLEKIFQLVCFHPKFKFEGYDTKEIANFVNRSPFPVIHILRSVDIENSLQDPAIAEKLSAVNENTLKAMNKKDFKEHFPDKYYQI